MEQVRNPLRTAPTIDSSEVVLTSHARYRLEERGVSLSEVMKILKRSEFVWTDVTPEGSKRYISRGRDSKGSQINVVWVLEDDHRLILLTVFVGPVEF